MVRPVFTALWYPLPYFRSVLPSERVARPWCENCDDRAITRLEGFFQHASGFQVTNLDPVECLPLARLDEFVLDDGARITIQHDL